MPNHIRNIVRFEGPKKDITKLLNTIKGDETVIDFEKIVPMPDNIFRGDVGTEEEKRYGKNNWYDWCPANWGTKWNAYGTSLADGETLHFDTAWAMPAPVMVALSKQYPFLKICVRWADEDTGHNVGEIHLQNGHQIFKNVPKGGTKQAYEMAFDIHDNAEDYIFNEKTKTYESKEQ